MEYKELKDQACHYVDELKPVIYGIADALHDHPETGMNEVFASTTLKKILQDHGFAIDNPVADAFPTAFHAVCGNGPFQMGFLAEYDALPGVGHGCGHSANGAMSFLAAAALKDLADLPVDVDLIGTPDEELRGGKVIMCDQGVFKDYDFAVMVHISPTKTNANSHFLALDDYRIAFHGQTAHAAGEPWNGRNALNGAMLALHAIDMLRQHVRPETRIGSYIVNGGMASNVVPDYAEIECCIRHSEREYLDTVVAKVMNCFKGAAIATETTYDVSQMGCKFDNMVWNEAATKASEQVLQAMDIPYEYPTDCGSSDVGNVSHQCPAVHVHLALGDVPMPEHSTDIANAVKASTIEPTIVKGAEIMGRLALLFAQDAALRQQMKDEFMSNGLSCNH